MPEVLTRPTRNAPLMRPLDPDINYDLRERDITENMWLWRHRQPSRHGIAQGRRHGAMSQPEAADALRLTETQYVNLERGGATLLTAENLAHLFRQRCWTPIEPTVAELCYLARRRAGLTLKAAAERMRVSTVTYLKAEENGDQRMLRFWTRQGFKFPVRRG